MTPTRETVESERGPKRPKCGMCEQPYHRYCDSDPEHEWSPTACINALRYALDLTELGMADLLTALEKSERRYERLAVEARWVMSIAEADFGMKCEALRAALTEKDAED